MESPAARNRSVRNRWLFLGLLVILLVLLVGLYLWFAPGQSDEFGPQLLPVSLHSLLKANYAKDPMTNAIPPMQLSLIGNALSDNSGATDVAGRLEVLINRIKTPVPQITLPGGTLAPTQTALRTATPVSISPTATSLIVTSTSLPTGFSLTQTAENQTTSPSPTEIPTTLAPTRAATSVSTQKPRPSATAAKPPTSAPPTLTMPPNTPIPTSVPPSLTPRPTAVPPTATQPPYQPPPTQPAPTQAYP